MDTTDELVLPQEQDDEIRILYSDMSRCFVFKQGDNRITLTFEEMDRLMYFAGEYR